MTKWSLIISRFLTIALILNGALLAMNWFKNANPDKDEMILWIAAANLVVGLFVYISGLIQRRRALRNEVPK